MKKNIIFIFFVFILGISCTPITIVERQVSLPNFEWESSLAPSFEFDIVDTNSYYNIFLFLRHQQMYAYNNIWLRVYINLKPTALDQSQEFVLANNKQWLGKAVVGDIVEHFIPITPLPIQIKQQKLKVYLQHIMRDDPLPHIMAVGVRVQKIKTNTP